MNGTLELFAVIALLVVVIVPIWMLVLLYGIKDRVNQMPGQIEWSRVLSELRRLRPEQEHRGAALDPAGVMPAPDSSPHPIPTVTEPAPCVSHFAKCDNGSPPPILPVAELASHPPPVLAALPVPPLSAAPEFVSRHFASSPPPPDSPSPLLGLAPEPPRAPGVFETAAREMLRKAWNWFVVGAEFRRQDVSAEFAIASNWLMRGGIFILVFGVGFFLKYSITRGLLGPEGRVALSVLAGIGLMVWGLRLFGKQYQLLGQGFVGGGLAMLYFSVYSAAVMFELIPLGPAFVLMAMVTAVSAVLAVRHDTLLVAVLGLLGGYATPLMLSTGSKNFPVLFGYMTLLGIGLLGVAWHKRWPLLTYLSLVCTHVLAVGAIVTRFASVDLPVVLPFLGVFFVLFSTAIFLYNLAKRERTTVIELIGLFVNAGFFFGTGYHVVVQVYPRAAAAWLAVGLACYYTAHVVVLIRRGPRDRALLTAFIALAASFLVITLPLLLTGSWLTAIWAVQAVALLWIALRLESPTLRRIAEGLLLLVLFRLVFLDFGDRFGESPPTLWPDYLRLLGDRAMQFGLPIVSFGVARRLLARAPATERAPTQRVESRFALGVALVVLFAYLTVEAWQMFHVCYRPFRLTAMTLVWVGFGAYLLANRRRLGAGGLAAFFMTALVVLGIKAFVDFAEWNPRFAVLAYAASERTAALALVRLTDCAALLAFFGAGWTLLRHDASNRALGTLSGWLALTLGLLYLTLETGTMLTQFVPGFRGGGISVLWGLYALALLVMGIRHASRSLRLVGLALLGITVVKIFAVDLDQLDTVYRIVAFLALGVVLLFAAFMYLKHSNRFSPATPKESAP